MRGIRCVSDTRCWDHRTDQLRSYERTHRKVLHAENLFKWAEGNGSGNQRDFGWLAASHSQRRNAQGSGFPGKRETEFASRLEASIQGKFGTDADRRTNRSSRGSEESGFAKPTKAALLSRKEKARASQIPPRQRTRYRTKHLRRNNGRRPDQVTRESATADAFAAGKIRRRRVLDFEFRS